MLQAPLLEASGRPAPHTATKLLVSHALTKLGSKAWEFATPLLLLRFSPGSLLAPTVFGLTIFLFRCAPARRAHARAHLRLCSSASAAHDAPAAVQPGTTRPARYDAPAAVQAGTTRPARYDAPATV